MNKQWIMQIKKSIPRESNAFYSVVKSFFVVGSLYFGMHLIAYLIK